MSLEQRQERGKVEVSKLDTNTRHLINTQLNMRTFGQPNIAILVYHVYNLYHDINCGSLAMADSSNEILFLWLNPQFQCRQTTAYRVSEDNSLPHGYKPMNDPCLMRSKR